MSTFRPLLASQLKNPSALKFPMYASPKLDGIRAIVIDGKLYSRNLKLIPNSWCQKLFAHSQYEGFDGELIVGSATDPNVYNKTSSGVMSYDGNPDVTYYIFDNADPSMKNEKYESRYQNIVERFYDDPDDYPRICVVEQVLINSEADLEMYETQCLARGYEGIMVRSLHGTYKYGRSTEREQTLLKVKRFTDGEAKIVGVVELRSNQNELVKDELGRSKRSHEIAGLIPMGTMGALVVQDLVTGVEFEIGSGFTAVQRQQYWDNSTDVIGVIVKYKHFEIGVKDRPRFPVYIGTRDKIDL